MFGKGGKICVIDEDCKRYNCKLMNGCYKDIKVNVDVMDNW